MILDIGPTSVRVEWPTQFLPVDDGGVPLQQVRLTPYLATAMKLTTANFTVDVQDGFTIISGLKDKTAYQIMVEFENAQGEGVSRAC